MERHIEKCLNRVSLFSVSMATILLLFIYFQTPKTCIPQNTPIIKPHHKFPSSTCDPSLNNRPHLSLSSKNRRLWSSNTWRSQLSSYTTFFTHIRQLGLLHNHSKILCVAAGAGHEVMALTEMGVGDVTGVEIVESLPLVSKADLNNLPFFDGVFDFVFSGHLTEALFPARFAGEMERVLRGGGVCVVVVEECGQQEVDEIVRLFLRSEFVGADNVTLIGVKMTRIIMRISEVTSS